MSAPQNAPLSAAEWQHAYAVLNDHNAKLTDDERASLLSVTQRFADQFLHDQWDTSKPLPPQALAMQPGTTHPQGDAAAKEEYLSDPKKAGLDALYVYEPPVRIAQQEMLENPQLVHALHPGTVISPEDVMKMKPGDGGLYDSYADYKWRTFAEQAAQQGKTAYRYSRAPYLWGTDGVGPMTNLEMKALGGVAPMMELKNAVVLGADKAITAGAGRRALDALSPHLPAGPGGRSIAEMNAESEENHPAAVMAGQALGSLAHWGVANKAFELATGVTAPIAGAATGLAGVGRQAVRAGVAGALGAGLDQSAREAVDYGANALQGQSQPELGERARRVGDAAQMGAVLGPGFDLLGQGMGAAADEIRWGDRTGPTVGRFEQAGGKFGTVRGPQAPAEAKQAVLDARAAGKEPVDVQAQALAPKIEQSVKANKSAQNQQVRIENDPFYPTAEGQMRLPNTEVTKTALDQLRSHNDWQDSMRPVVDPGKQTRVKEIFNNEMEGVSAQPVPGAIPISRAEANRFLLPARKAELMAQVSPPRGAESSSGAREMTGEQIESRAQEPVEEEFEPALARKKIDVVYVVPRRYTAEGGEQAIRSLQNLSEDSDSPIQREARELYLAALRDRDQRPMNGVTGGWSQLRQAQQSRIAAAQEEAGLAAPDGSAFRPLIDYAHIHRGQAELADAVRAAAERGGVREQLDQMRVLGELDNLRGMANFGKVGGLQRSPFSPNALLDAGSIRAFPLLRLGEGATYPIRGGSGGRLAVPANAALDASRAYFTEPKKADDKSEEKK